MMRGWSSLPERTRQILIWGSLWGIVVTTAEIAANGLITNSPWLNKVELIGWPTIGWCAVGCLHLFVARRALRRRGWWSLAAGWLAISVAWAVLAPWIGAHIGFLYGDQWRGTVEELIAYYLWPSLFFGALLVAAFALIVETDNTRALLQDAAIARNRTSALRAEAELSDFRRHVDSRMLLDVMADVERRYRSAPEQADDLLGRLVEFLRCAMPGLAGRTSTLRTEMQLARAFVSLQAARRLDAGFAPAASWIIDEAPDLPNLPFPGHLMLPLLALPSHSAMPRLQLRALASGAQIEVHGLGRQVPDEFMRRARASLRSLLGDAFALHVEGESGPQLALTLGLATTTGGFHDR